MNCLKCGCNIDNNDAVCLDCYLYLKYQNRISFIFHPSVEVENDLTRFYASTKHGDAYLAADMKIVIKHNDKNEAVLYTGLIKNEVPYGVGSYFFNDGRRYIGEYSPSGKLVKGTSIANQCYEDGLFEDFQLFDGIKNSLTRFDASTKHEDAYLAVEVKIEIKHDDENEVVLYTGLIKNEVPFGFGSYLFDDGCRYIGEYSPKGKLVRGIGIIDQCYQEGLFEDFELRKGVAIVCGNEDFGMNDEIMRFSLCYDEAEGCPVYDKGEKL